MNMQMRNGVGEEAARHVARWSELNKRPVSFSRSNYEILQPPCWDCNRLELFRGPAFTERRVVLLGKSLK